MAVATTYEHITLDDAGVPFIENTTTKIVELVIESKAYGWGPEEIHFQHPYLSLGQIHSAFAYYWDHRSDLDRDIQRRQEPIEEIRLEVESPEIRERLKAKGLL
ncbi:MAG: DUF433 domain-containing protein [Acidobacteria bacterium]|nr:DUF433 domain-containing protein [Acidobacteriota bacterium]